MHPSDRKYTKDHEWIAIDGDRGRVGITDYAQKQLGDVVFVQLPEVGATFKAGDVFGTVESVKAVSDLYSPMSGEVVEVNEKLLTQPELLNSDPHGAWIVVLKLTNPGEQADLLDHAEYDAGAK